MSKCSVAQMQVLGLDQTAAVNLSKCLWLHSEFNGTWVTACHLNVSHSRQAKEQPGTGVWDKRGTWIGTESNYTCQLNYPLCFRYLGSKATEKIMYFILICAESEYNYHTFLYAVVCTST